MSVYTTGAFWGDTAVRAVKTFAQSAIAVITAQATGLLNIDWLNMLSIAGLAALLSVLTSVASGDTVGGAAAIQPPPGPQPSAADYAVDTSAIDSTDAAVPADLSAQPTT